MGDEPIEYSSPPCFMHELEGFESVQEARDPQRDVNCWRKAERERLLGLRPAEGSAARVDKSAAIRRSLDLLIGNRTELLIGAYWPFKGEPDLHTWFEDFRQRGGRTALPQVAGKSLPLVFRAWRKDDRMERGVLGIPFPADGEKVVPDLVVAPLVGFDKAGYRLGYGSGFFDRTLASLAQKPKIVGVGYDQAAITTIYPQWYDVPMDEIITESGHRTYVR